MAEIYRRNGVWFSDYTVGGVRYRRTTKVKDRKLAKQIADQREQTAIKHQELGELAIMNFATAAQHYMEDGGDARFLAPLIRRFSAMRVLDIRPRHVRDAARDLLPGRSAATWNRQCIVPMSAVLNHAMEESGRTMRIKRFQERKVERPVGSAEWNDVFVATATRMGEHRLAAYARLIFTTGARQGQALKLLWEDVDLENGAVRLWTRKTGRRAVARCRSAILTDDLIAMMADLPRDHPRNLVFGMASARYANKLSDRVMEEAGLPRLTSHEWGRHAFATEMMVRNDVDPVTTARSGGWETPKLLFDRYAHANPDRAVINQVFSSKKQ